MADIDPSAPVMHNFCDMRKKYAESPEQAELMDAALAGAIMTKGKIPYLTADEALIMSNIANLRQNAAMGRSASSLATAIRGVIASKAISMAAGSGDNAAATKLLTASKTGVVRKTATRMMVTDMNNNNEDLRCGFLSPSDINPKRAAADNPALHQMWNTMVRDRLAKLYADGRIKDVPPASRVGNGDEIGMKEDGTTLRVYTQNRENMKGTRPYRVVQNEKASYWTSLFVVSIADGGHIPPVVIRDSANEATISQDMWKNLHPDFILWTTPSAYNTHEAFAKCLDHVGECMEVTPENPFFLTLDGHSSHFNATAIAKWEARGLFLIFLRSNASIVDQANDNGINAKLKRYYEIAYEAFRELHPAGVVPYTRTYMNEVLSAAWKLLIEDPTTRATIIGGFQITKTYPF
jgi:hypothetical protein